MSKPARLNKSDNCHKGMEAWLQHHATPILMVCIILLFLLIVALILAMAGVHAYQLTGTEANLQYNHLEAII